MPEFRGALGLWQVDCWGFGFEISRRICWIRYVAFHASAEESKVTSVWKVFEIEKKESFWICSVFGFVPSTVWMRTDVRIHRVEIEKNGDSSHSLRNQSHHPPRRASNIENVSKDSLRFSRLFDSWRPRRRNATINEVAWPLRRWRACVDICARNVKPWRRLASSSMPSRTTWPLPSEQPLVEDKSPEYFVFEYVDGTRVFWAVLQNKFREFVPRKLYSCNLYRGGIHSIRLLVVVEGFSGRDHVSSIPRG